MLVLSRKVTDSIKFPELGITIKILNVRGSKVRVGVNAPIEINVLRGELDEFDESAVTQKVIVSAKNEHDLRNQLNQLTFGVSLAKKLLSRDKFEEASSIIKDMLNSIGSNQPVKQTKLKIESEHRGICQPRRGLVVEDVENEREMLAGFLRLHGYEVATATDGLDAIEYLSRTKEKPEFILMDMNLPRLDGTKTIRMIRENPAYDDIAIFAISGSSSGSLKVDLASDRITKWFLKPLKPIRLMDTIQANFSAAI